ncbi:hypothetical protein Csa_022443 [Cucumis sativus]|uniref:Uncharacterized protein n=1 Tax=Cucumis sativus TaxID=3659 RepID=A0A0A0LRG6_CUCSA|nr:hypothetical protein Csa_022443 [Cucumis sativus]
MQISKSRDGLTSDEILWIGSGKVEKRRRSRAIKGRKEAGHSSGRKRREGRSRASSTKKKIRERVEFRANSSGGKSRE